MTVIVSDQSGQLSKTLTAWDEFEKRCSKYFPGEIRSILETSIGHTFSKIRILNNRLNSLGNELCNDQSTVCLDDEPTQRVCLGMLADTHSQ